MRAHDILNGFQILKAMAEVDPANIRAEASGIAGIWLLMAAALEPGISHIDIDRTPYSFARAFENPLTRDLHSAVIRGFSLQWELSDLVDSSRVTWSNPLDWLGHVVPIPGKYTYSPAAQ